MEYHKLQDVQRQLSAKTKLLPSEAVLVVPINCRLTVPGQQRLLLRGARSPVRRTCSKHQL